MFILNALSYFLVLVFHFSMFSDVKSIYSNGRVCYGLKSLYCYLVYLTVPCLSSQAANPQLFSRSLTQHVRSLLHTGSLLCSKGPAPSSSVHLWRFSLRTIAPRSQRWQGLFFPEVWSSFFFFSMNLLWVMWIFPSLLIILFISSDFLYTVIMQRATAMFYSLSSTQRLVNNRHFICIT